MVNNIGKMGGGRFDPARYPVQRSSRLDGPAEERDAGATRNPGSSSAEAAGGRRADPSRQPVQRPVGPELTAGTAGPAAGQEAAASVTEIGGGRPADVGRSPVQRPDLPDPASEAESRIASGGAEILAAGIAAAGPPVAIDRIAVIRNAIAEGRYRIDPSLIAERMIALDLLGRK